MKLNVDSSPTQSKIGKVSSRQKKIKIRDMEEKLSKKLFENEKKVEFKDFSATRGGIQFLYFSQLQVDKFLIFEG